MEGRDPESKALNIKSTEASELHMSDPWFDSPAALRDELPLSTASEDILDKLPVPPVGLNVGDMRKYMKQLDMKPAHSFVYKGSWYSHSAEQLREFYMARRRHMVGAQRTREWFATFPNVGNSVGAALTFWVDVSLDPEIMLPSALELSFKTVANAQFEKVFMLGYPAHQKIGNLPQFVIVLDCEEGTLFSSVSFMVCGY